ncbi:MAG: hypothetical protein IJT70_04935 [Clostridia bacterium]|nr:hypothetical protein [Clostridia bacterium]
MNKIKFTFNSFLVLVIIFSAMASFILVGVTNMSERSTVNSVNPIEGTDYYIRYSDFAESGIYDGDMPSSKLLLQGNFGYDWGASVSGATMICNEYRRTTLGIITCDVVKIDLETFDKDLLYKDAMMVGKCASGEIVCIDGYTLAPMNSTDNLLYDIYSMSSCMINMENGVATVRWFDPATGECVAYKEDGRILEEGRTDYYLNLTVSEGSK